MESEGSLLCSQGLTTRPCSNPHEPNSHPHTLFLKSYLEGHASQYLVSQYLHVLHYGTCWLLCGWPILAVTNV